jgi:hypothetical protein
MRTARAAFTRIELVATLAALGVLLSVTAAMTSAEPAKTATCHNNLRQLGVALLSYADDNAGNFPPRVTNPAWPERLRPYYKQTAVLTCPSDGPNPRSLAANPTNVADAAPRSYILNGWSDYFAVHVSPSAQPFPASAIREPSQTILLGEKVESSSHFWFDYSAGDDFSELDNGRHHRASRDSSSGASNHAFADGSVRLVKWGAAFNPVNLWFVEPVWRTNFIVF